MNNSDLSTEFDLAFRRWVNSACEDWGYRKQGEDYYSTAYSTLPEKIRALLGKGLKDGIVIPQGRRFTLKGLSSEKGPYNWFSRYSKCARPALNWEYFIQVAEYVRLYPIVEDKGFKLNFEDKLMDITIYRSEELLVCCEAKVKEDTKATTRCIPLDQEAGQGRCIVCGKPASQKTYFARAY